MDVRTIRIGGGDQGPHVLGTDALTLFQLQDQDTATKKRNRAAQRNHRERKRAAAASNTEATDGAKPKPQAASNTESNAQRQRNCQDQRLDNDFRLHEFLPSSSLPLLQGAHIMNEDFRNGVRELGAALGFDTRPEALDPYYHISQTIDPQLQQQHQEWFNNHMKANSMHCSGSDHTSMDLDGQTAVNLSYPSSRQSSLDARNKQFEADSEDALSDTRFEAILEAVEGAGFHSFDEMATAYYTGPLGKESPLRATQKFSRERQLKLLLKELNQSSKEWSSREMWAYQEEILESAQDILTDELSKLNVNDKDSDAGKSSASSDSSSSVSSSPIFDSFQSLLQDVEVNRVLKHEMRILREGVPDAWALLTRLAQNANIPQSTKSQVVAVFLHILVRMGQSL